jgi:hypothetical protein
MDKFNAFQWRTIAIIIREHLRLRRPISVTRAQQVVRDLLDGTRNDPELLSKIGSVR